jgi:hypothetical protein
MHCVSAGKLALPQRLAVLVSLRRFLLSLSGAINCMDEQSSAAIKLL